MWHLIKPKPLPPNESDVYVSYQDDDSENLLTTTTNKKKENELETKEEHNKIMEKKSKESIEKYDLNMIGNGVFKNLEKLKKTRKKLKGKKVET